MKCFATTLCAIALLALAPVVSFADEANGPDPGCGVEYWRTDGGTLSIVPSASGLEYVGLRIADVAQTDVLGQAEGLPTVFAAVDGPGLEIVSFDGIFRAFSGGDVQTLGEIRFETTDGLSAAIGDLRILRNRDESVGNRWVVEDTAHGHGVVFELMPSGLVDLACADERVEWNGLEIFVSESFARSLGLKDANSPIGVAFFQSAIEATDGINGLDGHEPAPVARSGRGGIGPDVIVGGLYDIRRWSTVGSQSSYSFGTESCNIGDVEAIWIAGNNQHPVIGQSVYRLKDNRFEQIGQGWLKHSFCAIDLNLCDPCVDLFGCDYLSVGCSDPYSAGLNGSQSGLGPRYQVNASTGFFPYPPANPAYGGGLARRTILQHADIAPASNPGAVYFVEGHYITPDDAAAGNGNNNASWRKIQFNSSFNCSFAPGSTTVREEAAIFAWQDEDPSVLIRTINLGDGIVHVAWKVVDNGNGTWDYIYAIENQNSHTSVSGLEIPVPPGVNVTNVYFNSPDYHSGELVDNGDWDFSRLADKVVWEGESFADNPNAHALRWSTTFTFAFTADTAPTNTRATGQTWRTVGDFSIAMQGPGEPTNPFDATIDLVSLNSPITIGERFLADASIVTGVTAPETEIQFLLEVDRPDGSLFGTILNRTKSVPGNKTRTREVRFNGADETGEWTMRLRAIRTSDNAELVAEDTFTVNP